MGNSSSSLSRGQSSTRTKKPPNSSVSLLQGKSSVMTIVTSKARTSRDSAKGEENSTAVADESFKKKSSMDHVTATARVSFTESIAIDPLEREAIDGRSHETIEQNDPTTQGESEGSSKEENHFTEEKKIAETLVTNKETPHIIAQKIKEHAEPIDKKELVLVREAMKRSKQRNSLSLLDHLSNRDRRRLLSKDNIIPLNTPKFQNEMLKVHNSFRADHGVPPLRLSKKLNKAAQERAEAQLAEKTSGPARCEKSYVGENVYCSDGTNNFKMVPSALQACSAWYEYSGKFDFENQARFPRDSVHFMNMVWASSKEMGVGRAVDGSGRTRVVTLYKPKPEMPFLIKLNVKPPQAEVVKSKI